ENALIDYQGTLLIVDDDRYYINRLATKVLEINPKKTTLYLGDYDYYLHKKEELYEQQKAKEQAVLEEKDLHSDTSKNFSTENEQTFVDRKEKKRQTRRLKREISSAEEKIAAIEETLENLTNEMNQLSNSEEVI